MIQITPIDNHNTNISIVDNEIDSNTISNESTVHFRVINIPLSTDIANPELCIRYMTSISVSKNNTQINVISNIEDDDQPSNTLTLTLMDEKISIQMLDGNINIVQHKIRWSDGSSWTKLITDVQNTESLMNGDMVIEAKTTPMKINCFVF